MIMAMTVVGRVVSRKITSSSTRCTSDAFFDIEEAWTEAGDRFMLWRGQQSGIGELMTVVDNGQRSCVGYAAFRQRWYNDPEFKQWFSDFKHSPRGGSARLRKVSHGLRALIKELDPKGHLMAAYSRIDEEQGPERTVGGHSRYTYFGGSQTPERRY